jgi:hypothetical protein
MPITATITISQAASPASFTVTDTTANQGTETYTNRTLTVLDSQNQPLPGYPNPIPFGFITYPTGVISLTGLTQDLALTVTMTLTPTVVVEGSVYVATNQVALNRYLEQGLYNIQAARFLSTDLVGLADVQAQLSSMDILIEQVNSQTSVLYGSLVAAQEALDRGQNVINNQVL